MHTRKDHPVQMWTGKQTPEQPNDRLVVLSWKGNEKTGRVAHSARCFSIPVWQPQLTGQDTPFLDMLVDAVEQRQKLTAHKYVTDMLNTNGGVCNDIPAYLLDPTAILQEFMSEDSDDGSRGKISAAQIKTWFEATLAPVVMVKLAEKNNWLELTAEQEKQLVQSANNYRATLERLAAPTPKVDISTAKALKKAVELLGDATDNVANKLLKKLNTIIDPPAESNYALDAL